MYEAAKHSISSRTLVVNIWKLNALAVTAKRQIKTATKNDSLYHRQQHFSVVSNLLRPHFIRWASGSGNRIQTSCLHSNWLYTIIVDIRRTLS